MTTQAANPKLAASDLFQKTALGPLTLANRIVMAPLIRSRAFIIRNNYSG